MVKFYFSNLFVKIKCSKKLLLGMVLLCSNIGYSQYYYGKFPYSNTMVNSEGQNAFTLYLSSTNSSHTNSAAFTDYGFRLTNNKLGGEGVLAILNDVQFPSIAGIHVEFDFSQFSSPQVTSGTYADGMSFFLYDASKTISSSFATGGCLGYLYSNATNNSYNGLNGGFLSLGLDLYGSNSVQFNNSSNKYNGIPGSYFPGFDYKSHVSLRGPAGVNNADLGTYPDLRWGYPLLYTTRTWSNFSTGGGYNQSATLNPNWSGTDTASLYMRSTTPNVSSSFFLGYQVSGSDGTTPPDWSTANGNNRRAFIDVIPGEAYYYITLKIQHGTVMETMLNNFAVSKSSIKYNQNDQNTGTINPQTVSVPSIANFGIGFSASTGTYSVNQYLRNLIVSVPYAAVTNNDSTNLLVHYDGSGLVKTATINVFNNDYAYRKLAADEVTTSDASPINIDTGTFRFNDGFTHLYGSSTPAASDNHTYPTSFTNNGTIYTLNQSVVGSTQAGAQVPGFAKNAAGEYVGYFTYNGDGTVTYTLVDPNFVGRDYIYYSIKGFSTTADGGTALPYGNNNDMYRASAAYIAVNIPYTLPITYSPELSVTKVNNTSVLAWGTAQEVNAKNFIVERSANGKNWVDIGVIPANGTTSFHHDYSYTDDSPLSGGNYYRLQQTDLDGGTSYSIVQSVSFDNTNGAILVYPNPAVSTLTVANVAVGQQLMIIGMDGKLYQTVTITATPQTIDISGLAAGMYIVKVHDNNDKAMSVKFFKK
ncbi:MULTISPECIES: T9SS type A sorting domain-containing protein [Chitinophagaceae]